MTRLRPDYRQGVCNRNDILLLSVVYSLSYEVKEVCVRAKMRDGERVLGCSELEAGYGSVLMRKLEYV